MSRCAHGHTEACLACYPPVDSEPAWFSTDDHGLSFGRYRARRRSRLWRRLIARTLAALNRDRSRRGRS